MKQVALMVLLTRARAPRFLGTMWYYFSLLLIFTFVTFIHYFSYVCILFLADCLEYKQLDIVEFLRALQGACEAGAGGLLDS